MSFRASKRMHGSMRNIANQLAQIAAGWEASTDGPVLLGQPTTGSYVIDLDRSFRNANRNAITVTGPSIRLDRFHESGAPPIDTRRG
jgi:hypothetical protein